MSAACGFATDLIQGPQRRGAVLRQVTDFLGVDQWIQEEPAFCLMA